MILAKNRYGQIGRQVPGVGINANVVPASMGEARGSVNISTRSIEEDQARYLAEEIEAKKKRQQDRIRQVATRVATEARRKARGAQVMQFQKLAQLDPMNERLKAHYARQKGMGESELVSESLLRTPADFSSQGGNPQIVASESGKRPIAYFADFRQELIVGNPLTRNGEYGPAVTDYDRFVNGVDVNQTDVVEIAGGTMLGRYDGQPVPAGMAGKMIPMPVIPIKKFPVAPGRMVPMPVLPPRIPIKMPINDVRALSGMGFDFSWDGLVDSASDVLSQTGDNLVDALPTQLAKELQNAISQGGTVKSTSGNTVVIQRPVTGTTSTEIVNGVPNWVTYGAGVMIGMGFLLMIVKAVKS